MIPRYMGASLFGLATVLLVASSSVAQVIPPVTGRTFTLPTSPNHKLFIPDSFDLSADGVDVLVHFHGDPATVNNNAGYADLNAVIINVTYSGFSSAYSTPFSDPALFGNVLDGALDTLRAQPDFAASTQWDQLAVSSFSAGYGAVREILKQPSYYDQIDGLLLADSLYAGFTSSVDHTPNPAQMADFKRFALDAANSQKTMIVSQSQVLTYTYANTAETADDLMQHVGVSPIPANESGLGTLQFYRKTQLGDFGVWGATGSDGAAHSRHLQYMAQWLGDLPLTDVVVPPRLTGDVNADGFVGIDDMNIILLNWNQAVPKGDIDQGDLAGIGDGFVGVDDLNIVLLNWNTGTPPPVVALANIPEPSAVLLFGAALVGVLAGHRRSAA